MVEVMIPTPLRGYTGGNECVSVPAGTVSAVIQALVSVYPGVQTRILDDAGNVRRFMNVYVNDEDIRFVKGLETEVRDGDAVYLVPAIAGGSGS